ncbi:MAG: spore germination protein [Anaeromicrobium sp.]|jgi:spore germination protein (amino acid permease)|uniref:GerAB/ArcD/ProY family transporter n=1 Tax=Anaeromicrobium sp. TaxID=1929132 RepID=UPI0025EC0284|nr:GerAB/ArcD/ProY family transporter [Anaeromicrobium sp.]MCT4594011.1 spore germination protein [Anaeromicrobium sp.]
MNKQKNLINSSELGSLLIGFSVGPAFLRFSNALVETAGHDAWISAIIGLTYPLYVILIANFIIARHPTDGILLLNKKYFGNLLGNIINFIFISQFTLVALTVTSDFVNLSLTYIVPFLSPLKIIIVAISLGAYASSNDLNVLGRMNKLINLGYLIVLFSLVTIKDGDISNIQPIFGTGLLNIIKANKITAYYYTGWESIFLLYPYVVDPKSIKEKTLKAVAIGGTIWVWAVFSTIIYLGVDILPKSYWSYIFVFESIQVPVINNFRYIFTFVWVLIVIRVISNYYFASVLGINEFIKVDIKKISIYIYPFMVFIALILSNNLLKESILSVASPSYIIFNLVLFTLLALLISFKPKY